MMRTVLTPTQHQSIITKEEIDDAAVLVINRMLLEQYIGCPIYLDDVVSAMKKHLNMWSTPSVSQNVLNAYRAAEWEIRQSFDCRFYTFSRKQPDRVVSNI